jgi:hypothetical protein
LPCHRERVTSSAAAGREDDDSVGLPEPDSPASHSDRGGPKRAKRAESDTYVRKQREKSDTSLFNLTLQFRELLREAGQGHVDLNKAAAKLNVRKRRVYDITNVLEGVELIEQVRACVVCCECLSRLSPQTSKNFVRWKRKAHENSSGGSDNQALQRRLEEARAEREALTTTLSELERKVGAQLEEAERSDWGFVTHEDLRELPELDNRLVFVVKSTSGFQLTFSTAEDAGKRECWVTGRKAPVDVLFITPLLGDVQPSDDQSQLLPETDDEILGLNHHLRGEEPPSFLDHHHPQDAPSSPTLSARGPHTADGFSLINRHLLFPLHYSSGRPSSPISEVTDGRKPPFSPPRASRRETMSLARAVSDAIPTRSQAPPLASPSLPTDTGQEDIQSAIALSHLRASNEDLLHSPGRVKASQAMDLLPTASPAVSLDFLSMTPLGLTTSYSQGVPASDALGPPPSFPQPQ